MREYLPLLIVGAIIGVFTLLFVVVYALEKNILENLRSSREGKTTILIAHRISTIEQMDKILFIDDGALAAVGKHRELYETCPEYRKMVDLQRLEEEGGSHNG